MNNYQSGCNKSLAIVDQIRSHLPILSSMANGHPLCYLDNAATAPIADVVLESMLTFETTQRGNISRSNHFLGSQATQAYWRARERVAHYLNAASAEEIIFTSGTTMSINLLANSLGLQLNAGDEIVISQTEHHSNFVPWQMLSERIGIRLKIVPITADARLDLSALEELVTDRCRLIALTHASNVTGAITDVEKVVQAAKRVGAQVLLDGAQVVPHGPVYLQALGIDYYAFSGHKCFGPTGIGVLWARQAVLEKLTPFLGGGGMVRRVSSDRSTFIDGHRGLEAGTPPIAQAVGLGCALDWLQSLPWAELKASEHALSEKVLAALGEIPGLTILGPKNTKNRLPIFSFSIEKHHAHDICHLLDQQGVALRGGHHCTQPLLDAYDLIAVSRASFGLYNNQHDIEQFVAALTSAINTLEN